MAPTDSADHQERRFVPAPVMNFAALAQITRMASEKLPKDQQELIRDVIEGLAIAQGRLFAQLGISLGSDDDPFTQPLVELRTMHALNTFSQEVTHGIGDERDRAELQRALGLVGVTSAAIYRRTVQSLRDGMGVLRHPDEQGKKRFRAWANDRNIRGTDFEIVGIVIKENIDWAVECVEDIGRQEYLDSPMQRDAVFEILKAAVRQFDPGSHGEDLRRYLWQQFIPSVLDGENTLNDPELRVLMRSFRQATIQSRTDSPNTAQLERRHRFRAWAEGQGITAEDFTVLVWKVNRHYLSAAAKILASMTFPKAKKQALQDALGLMLAKTTWAYDPADGEEFSAILERNLKERADFILDKDVTDPQEITPERVCHRKLTTWQFPDSENERQRQQDFRKWMKDFGIEHDDFNELMMLAARKFIPWLLSELDKCTFDPETKTRAYNDATKRMMTGLLVFDPQRGISFEIFSWSYIRTQIAKYLSADAPPDTAAAAPPEPTHFWEVIPLQDIPALAGEAFANVRSRCELTKDPLKQESFRAWAGANGVVHDDFEQVVQGMFGKCTPWLLGNLRHYSVLPTGDPRKTVKTACEEMALSLHFFDPSKGDNFPGYAWGKLFKRVGKYMKGNDGAAPTVSVDGSGIQPMPVVTPKEEKKVPVEGNPQTPAGRVGNEKIPAAPEEAPPAPIEEDAAAQLEEVPPAPPTTEGPPAPEGAAPTPPEQTAEPVDPQQVRDADFMRWLSKQDIIPNNPAHGARLLADHYDSLAENAAGKMKTHEINKKVKLPKKDLTNAAKTALLAYCREYHPTVDGDFVQNARGVMERAMKQAIYMKERASS